MNQCITSAINHSLKILQNQIKPIHTDHVAQPCLIIFLMLLKSNQTHWTQYLSKWCEEKSENPYTWLIVIDDFWSFWTIAIHLWRISFRKIPGAWFPSIQLGLIPAHQATVKSDLSLGHSTKCEYGSKLHEGNVHHHAMILLCCHGTTAMVLNQLPRHYYQAWRRDRWATQHYKFQEYWLAS